MPVGGFATVLRSQLWRLIGTVKDNLSPAIGQTDVWMENSFKIECVSIQYLTFWSYQNGPEHWHHI
jgi:hypothetical protein